MNIEIPAIPAGVLTLLAFFSPYAVALAQHPAWPARYKRLAAILVSVLLTIVVLVFYQLITGDPVSAWPVYFLYALVVQQAAYGLLIKPSAAALESRHGVR